MKNENTINSLTVAVLAVLMILFSCAAAGVGEPGTRQELAHEYELKAVFLFNFLKYINWEDNPNEEYFNIAVLGESKILPPLEEIAAKRKAKNLNIEVHEISDLNNEEFFHLLFIPDAAKERWRDLSKLPLDARTVTIAESHGFPGRASAFEFLINDGKLRFKINQEEIAETGVSVSSQLLKLAQAK